MESECRQQLGEGRFEQRIRRKRHVLDIRELKKNSRGRRRRQAVKLFRHNPYVFLSMYLLSIGYTVCFHFSMKFKCLQPVFLKKRIADNCWNIDQVLQTTWKWSNWRLTREQDGTNVSLISHIHVRFLSGVISFIVLPLFLIEQRRAFNEFTYSIGSIIVSKLEIFNFCSLIILRQCQRSPLTPWLVVVVVVFLFFLEIK